MKLLIVSQHFWPELIRINDTAQALRACGTSVTVLTGKPNYPEGTIFPGYRSSGVSTEKWNDIDILRVPLIPRRGGSAFQLTLNYLSFIFSGLTIGPFLLRGRKIDSVLVFGSSPLLQALVAIPLAKIKSASLVIWVQDLWPESLQSTGYVRNRFLLAIVRRIVSFIYAQADLILVQSPEFIASVAELAGTSPIEIQYNQAEVSQANEVATAQETLVIPELGQQFDVVFAGNLGTAQSLETIVEAASLLRAEKNLRFFIVGTGSRVGWLREQIKSRTLTGVILTGQYDSAHMPSIFARASVLLGTMRNHPNYNRTIPTKVQAYLAAGKPIVLSMNGAGAAVLEKAAAGVHCRADDASELAKAILMLKAMPASGLKAMGERGRAFYENNFEPGSLAIKLLAHLEKLSNQERCASTKVLSTVADVRGKVQ